MFYNGDVLAPCAAISMNTVMVITKGHYWGQGYLSWLYGGQRAFPFLLLGFLRGFWPAKNVTESGDWSCCDTLREPTLRCSLPMWCRLWRISERITPVPHQSHSLSVNAKHAQKELVIMFILSAPWLAGTLPAAKKTYEAHINESLCLWLRRISG